MTKKVYEPSISPFYYYIFLSVVKGNQSQKHRWQHPFFEGLGNSFWSAWSTVLPLRLSIMTGNFSTISHFLKYSCVVQTSRKPKFSIPDNENQPNSP